MIFHQIKKNNTFAFFWILLAVISGVLVFFTPVRRAFEGGAVRVSDSILPERTQKADSENSLLLMARISDLTEENERLRGSLRMKNADGSTVPAKVVVGGGFMYSDVLMLDEGSDSGIEEGSLVFFGAAQGPEILGKISETGNNWSKAVPFSVVGQKTVLRSGKDKSIVFEAVGVGGGEMRTELPSEVELKVGDIVWWGEGSSYVLGMIGRAESHSGSQLREFYIKIPVSLGNLREVMISRP
ncbi:hypothetical protein HYT01_02195 [Candidatus Giovannonibacteria bacterium]|nr:hypothetical protein [Candidatus Giovannonibacteria bacterium]